MNENIILKTFCIVCGKWNSSSNKKRIPVMISFSNKFRDSVAGVCKDCAKNEDIKPYLLKDKTQPTKEQEN